MKRWIEVRVAIASWLGTVLASVLGDDDSIRVVGPREASADVVLIDIEHQQQLGKPLAYDGKTPVIALAFAAANRARLAPSCLSANCSCVCFVQKPLSLSRLREAIRTMPAGADRLYRHAGINLYYHLSRSLRSSHPRQADVHLFQRQLARHCPELSAATPGALERGLELLPYFILFSLHRGLAHDGGQRGLMKVLDWLMGMAKDCHDALPGCLARFQDSVQAYLHCQERSDFLAATEELCDLVAIAASVHAQSISILSEFNERHMTIQRLLCELENDLAAAGDLQTPAIYDRIHARGDVLQRQIQTLLARRNEVMKGVLNADIAD